MTYTPVDPPLGFPLDHLETGIVAVEDAIAEQDATQSAALGDTRAAVSALNGQVQSMAAVQSLTDRDLSAAEANVAALQSQVADMNVLIASLQQRNAASRGYLLVVPFTASPLMKAGADLILTGTDDVSKINALTGRAAALQSFSSKSPATAEQAGRVMIAGGRVNVETSLLMRDGVTVCGVGNLTELRASSALGSKPMVALASPNEHAWSLRDLWLNGNNADGGTGHGIDIDMTGSTNAGVSSYPSLSPDSDFTIQDLIITNFDGGQRAALKMGATLGTAANCRGNMVSRLQIRHAWRGVWLTAASDCHLDMIHVGSCADAGFVIEGGNTKGVSLKAYYSGTGFRIAGGRSSFGVLEAQDNNLGFDFVAGEVSAAVLLADSSESAGIRVAASSLMLHGVNILARTGSGTRFASQASGLKIDGTFTDVVITGRVGSNGIVQKITGSPAARWFLRLVGGNLDSVG
jgi:hypothetical protein